MIKFFVLIAFLAVSVGGYAQEGDKKTLIPPSIDALMQKYTCKACHRVDIRLVGPSFHQIMQEKKYKPAQIVALIYKPVPAHWPGYPPMAAVSFIPKPDALKIAKWIAKL